MQTHHTPGPWTAAEQFDGDESLGIAVSAGRQEIVRVYDIGGEGFANARLIAAAPDLLAAAIEALETFDRRFPDSPTTGDLRAAIARATGRQF